MLTGSIKTSYTLVLQTFSGAFDKYLLNFRQNVFIFIWILYCLKTFKTLRGAFDLLNIPQCLGSFPREQDIYIYIGYPKKILTMLSMLCRTANWSLFKKEPLPRNVWFGCHRALKFENKWVSQFVLTRFGVLIQQVCNPLAMCRLW